MKKNYFLVVILVLVITFTGCTSLNRINTFKAKEALENGDFEAIQDYLGLEDDYIFDII